MSKILQIQDAVRQQKVDVFLQLVESKDTNPQEIVDALTPHIAEAKAGPEQENIQIHDCLAVAVKNKDFKMAEAIIVALVKILPAPHFRKFVVRHITQTNGFVLNRFCRHLPGIPPVSKQDLLANNLLAIVCGSLARNPELFKGQVFENNDFELNVAYRNVFQIDLPATKDAKRGDIQKLLDAKLITSIDQIEASRTHPALLIILREMLSSFGKDNPAALFDIAKINLRLFELTQKPDFLCKAIDAYEQILLLRTECFQVQALEGLIAIKDRLEKMKPPTRETKASPSPESRPIDEDDDTPAKTLDDSLEQALEQVNTCLDSPLFRFKRLFFLGLLDAKRENELVSAQIAAWLSQKADDAAAKAAQDELDEPEQKRRNRIGREARREQAQREAEAPLSEEKRSELRVARSTARGTAEEAAQEQVVVEQKQKTDRVRKEIRRRHVLELYFEFVRKNMPSPHPKVLKLFIVSLALPQTMRQTSLLTQCSFAKWAHEEKVLKPKQCLKAHESALEAIKSAFHAVNTQPDVQFDPHDLIQACLQQPPRLPDLSDLDLYFDGLDSFDVNYFFDICLIHYASLAPEIKKKIKKFLENAICEDHNYELLYRYLQHEPHAISVFDRFHLYDKIKFVEYILKQIYRNEVASPSAETVVMRRQLAGCVEKILSEAGTAGLLSPERSYYLNNDVDSLIVRYAIFKLLNQEPIPPTLINALIQMPNTYRKSNDILNKVNGIYSNIDYSMKEALKLCLGLIVVVRNPHAFYASFLSILQNNKPNIKKSFFKLLRLLPKNFLIHEILKHVPFALSNNDLMQLLQTTEREQKQIDVDTAKLLLQHASLFSCLDYPAPLIHFPAREGEALDNLLFFIDAENYKPNTRRFIIRRLYYIQLAQAAPGAYDHCLDLPALLANFNDTEFERVWLQLAGVLRERIASGNEAETSGYKIELAILLLAKWKRDHKDRCVLNPDFLQALQWLIPRPGEVYFEDIQPAALQGLADLYLFLDQRLQYPMNEVFKQIMQRELRVIRIILAKYQILLNNLHAVVASLEETEDPKEITMAMCGKLAHLSRADSVHPQIQQVLKPTALSESAWAPFHQQAQQDAKQVEPPTQLKSTMIHALQTAEETLCVLLSEPELKGDDSPFQGHQHIEDLLYNLATSVNCLALVMDSPKYKRDQPYYAYMVGVAVHLIQHKFRSNTPLESLPLLTPVHVQKFLGPDVCRALEPALLIKLFNFLLDHFVKSDFDLFSLANDLITSKIRIPTPEFRTLILRLAFGNDYAYEKHEDQDRLFRYFHFCTSTHEERLECLLHPSFQANLHLYFKNLLCGDFKKRLESFFNLPFESVTESKDAPQLPPVAAAAAAAAAVAEPVFIDPDVVKKLEQQFEIMQRGLIPKFTQADSLIMASAARDVMKARFHLNKTKVLTLDHLGTVLDQLDLARESKVINFGKSVLSLYDHAKMEAETLLTSLQKRVESGARGIDLARAFVQCELCKLRATYGADLLLDNQYEIARYSKALTALKALDQIADTATFNQELESTITQLRQALDARVEDTDTLKILRTCLDLLPRVEPIAEIPPP